MREAAARSKADEPQCRRPYSEAWRATAGGQAIRGAFRPTRRRLAAAHDFGANSLNPPTLIPQTWKDADMTRFAKLVIVALAAVPLTPQSAAIGDMPLPHGVQCDGEVDDAAAIQHLFDSSRSHTVRLPEGTCNVCSTVSIERNGMTVLGSGKSGTVLTACPGSYLDHILRISAQGVFLGHLRLNGAERADDALVLHNAGASQIEHIAIRGHRRYGIRFDNFADITDGNNNGLTLNNVTVNGWNPGSAAVAGIAVPQIQPDNNEINILASQVNNHSGPGLLIKGQGWRVFGGNYFANGGYGIQVGDAEIDNTFSTGHAILFPWLESNALGDVWFNKSSRSMFFTLGVAGIGDVRDDIGTNIKLEPANLGDLGVLEVTGGKEQHTVQIKPNGKSSHIEDPENGSVVDVEARATINAILDALERYGVMAKPGAHAQTSQNQQPGRYSIPER